MNGNNVGDTTSRFNHNASGATSGIQRQWGLCGDVHGWSVEGLEHYLGSFLPVGLWVQRNFGQEDAVFIRGHTELVAEDVVPDFLHIVPVGHNAVLAWFTQSQNVELRLWPRRQRRSPMTGQ